MYKYRYSTDTFDAFRVSLTNSARKNSSRKPSTLRHANRKSNGQSTDNGLLWGVSNSRLLAIFQIPKIGFIAVFKKRATPKRKKVGKPKLKVEMDKGDSRFVGCPPFQISENNNKILEIQIVERDQVEVVLVLYCLHNKSIYSF